MLIFCWCTYNFLLYSQRIKLMPVRWSLVKRGLALLDSVNSSLTMCLIWNWSPLCFLISSRFEKVLFMLSNKWRKYLFGLKKKIAIMALRDRKMMMMTMMMMVMITVTMMIVTMTFMMLMMITMTLKLMMMMMTVSMMMMMMMMMKKLFNQLPRYICGN